MVSELVLASENLHKIREFRVMFKKHPEIEVYSLRDYPDYKPPEETGTTFEANARLKANHAGKALKKLVIADDSGLVVPKLDGDPGVFSRRYAGEDASDADNRKKLLKELDGKTGLERAAYYECCIALADESGIIKTFSGHCEGEITESERGRNGFGYDSLFIKYDYDKTFAELDDSVKNLISHRSKAFEKLLVYLELIKK